MRFTCLLVTNRERERERERGWEWDGGTLGGIRDWLNQDVISRNREERL